MPELSSLQEIVLEILEMNSDKNLLSSKTCSIRNQDIYKAIKPESMRPASVDYLSNVLKDLERKNKLKIDTQSLPGHQGRRRIITIL